MKHHQHCVAGKTLDGKYWVRPVSNREGGELDHEQAKCRNPHGLFNVKPLQKVTIGLAEHVSLINQPENYLIDDSEWRQNYRLDESEIVNYLESPNDIWGAGDRVDFSLIKSGVTKIEQSLYLVKVCNLKLFVNQYNKRRASFSYNNIAYELAVTDPLFDQIIANNTECKGILCVSLGEAFEGCCYKLVATIF